jgi:hypothetical protein
VRKIHCQSSSPLKFLLILEWIETEQQRARWQENPGLRRIQEQEAHISQNEEPQAENSAKALGQSEAEEK